MDRRGSGSVLLGRLMNLSSIVGPILNERYITEKTVNEHFINSRLVTFNQYRSFIEKCVNRNPFPFDIDWLKLRNVCWSRCEAWHLQALPFDIPEGIVPHELNNTIYWLWSVFCQLTEGDTYPPSADYEEIELLLRKIFSSLGLLWEDHDDAMTAMSGSSLASSSITAEQNDRVRSDAELDGRVSDHETSSLEDHYSDHVTETLLVTFQQFLSIISDMIGTEMILSPAFGRAVTQIYLTEVDGIIKTGWLSLKKPGTDTWRRRWCVIKKNSFEFYSNTLCDTVKYKILLNHKMHVESLPDTSSHKHRFRLVEREGDFNIAWEAEMSSVDAQHSHSWMLVLNLTMKIQQTGLTTKQIEVAERKLERHRRRESQLAALEKRQEVKKTRKRLEEVRERWNLMQTRLTERAANRDAMMEKLEKMEEIYDKLQAVAKKQSLLRKSDRKIRSAFPSFSDENDSSLSREEKLLIKSRDDKLGEQRKRFDELNEEKRKLQEELMEVQASAMLSKDKEKTLILVFGPEKEADLLSEQQSTHADKSSNFVKKNNTQISSNGKPIPIISVTNSSTSLSNIQNPDGFVPNLCSSVSHSESSANGSISNSSSSERLSGKNDIVSSLDSDMSTLSGERLV